MADVDHRAKRPLSPHLQIYSPMLTMMMSIVHRLTGIALYAGTLLLAYWLLSLVSGEAAYTDAREIFGSFFGRLVLFGYTWALIHHMFGGIRHFIWDTGRGLEPDDRELLVKLGLIGSIVVTIVIWCIGYYVV
ncbi:MAG: succinate dehydrogenase, cytochrome b556 subunit [Hyphomicrobiales bacterium]|nr:MAG: succinate dehydrogenase, cytochrome b556 subunit [Hyphomicrobiales bacterium]